MLSYSRQIILRSALLVALLPLALTIFSCSNNDNESTKLSGFVQSDDQPIQLSTITLFSTGTGQGPQMLGEALSDASGFFSISYRIPSVSNAVLYLTADSTFINASQTNINSSETKQEHDLNFIRLATVLGTKPVLSEIVINELTTIATAYAMAQFITPTGIDGMSPGLQNAAATLRNLVNLETGEVGSVLGNFPNGIFTSTVATFNFAGEPACGVCENGIGMLSSFFSCDTAPGRRSHKYLGGRGEYRPFSLAERSGSIDSIATTTSILSCPRSGR